MTGDMHISGADGYVRASFRAADVCDWPGSPAAELRWARPVARRCLDDDRAMVGISRRSTPPTHQDVDWVEADLSAPGVGELLAAGLPDLTATAPSAGVRRSAHLGASDRGALDAMWRLHVDVASPLVNALAARRPDGALIVLLGSRTSTGVAGKSMLANPNRAATSPRLPPLGHFIAPLEMADPVGFLLNPRGRSITGQRRVVCAGASL